LTNFQSDMKFHIFSHFLSKWFDCHLEPTQYRIVMYIHTYVHTYKCTSFFLVKYNKKYICSDGTNS
jgi:hypothetical protein